MHAIGAADDCSHFAEIFLKTSLETIYRRCRHHFLSMIIPDIVAGEILP